MIDKAKYLLFISLSIFIISACSQSSLPTHSSNLSKSSNCYIIYDAGSSGTRLYIYENRGEQWFEHEGPKVDALADPVREIRGKSQSDIDDTTDQVVKALENIKKDGPRNDKGQPQWQAFNWSQQCHIVSAKVLATAGMRIAEQENRQASAKLWKQLKQKLQAKMGKSVPISTRTLSGYEEGLFAWLTVRKQNQINQFGIVEMGGASSQITFPCKDCNPNNDALKTIILDDQAFRIYSYSFLGLGQDEAPKSLGFSRNCSYGIGTLKSNWQESNCANCISFLDDTGIYDPYNYQNGILGKHNQLPESQKQVPKWYLTGAFNYVGTEEIAACCIKKSNCYNKETSCFRAVYLKKYLYILNIPANSEKVDASWTKGAVLCDVDNCMRAAGETVCRWSSLGCL